MAPPSELIVSVESFCRFLKTDGDTLKGRGYSRLLTGTTTAVGGSAGADSNTESASSTKVRLSTEKSHFRSNSTPYAAHPSQVNVSVDNLTEVVSPSPPSAFNPLAIAVDDSIFASEKLHCSKIFSWRFSLPFWRGFVT